MEQSWEKHCRSSASETRSLEEIAPASPEGGDFKGTTRYRTSPTAGDTTRLASLQLMSAHSSSHCRADDRLNRLRYSWEREETHFPAADSSVQPRPIEAKNSLNLIKQDLKTSVDVSCRGRSVEQEKNSTDGRPPRSTTDIYRRWTRRSFRKGRMKMDDSEAVGKKSSSLRMKSTKKCARRVMNELEERKHVLRQSAGRRLMHVTPPEIKGQTGQGHAKIVYRGGGGRRGLQGPTADEHETRETIERLKSYLEKLRLSKQRKGEEIAFNRLYRKPATKRVFVYGENDSLDSCPQSIKADSMLDLLSSATAKLHLSRPARYLYTLNGRQLKSFEDIDADQVIRISNSKPGEMGNFFSSLDDRQVTQVKANWVRARKIYGPRVTDIVVVKSTEARTDIGVGAFGPSLYSSKTRNH